MTSRWQCHRHSTLSGWQPACSGRQTEEEQTNVAAMEANVEKTHGNKKLDLWSCWFAWNSISSVLYINMHVLGVFFLPRSKWVVLYCTVIHSKLLLMFCPLHLHKWARVVNWTKLKTAVENNGCEQYQSFFNHMGPDSHCHLHTSFLNCYQNDSSCSSPHTV